MNQITLFGDEEKKFISLKEAANWASEYLNRKMSISNMTYLLKYGILRKYGGNGNPLINIEELKNYYDLKNKIWEC